MPADTHLHFLLEFCDDGELYALLHSRGNKLLPECEARFYVSEVLLALQYLHLQGFIYRWVGLALLRVACFQQERIMLSFAVLQCSHLQCHTL